MADDSVVPRVPDQTHQQCGVFTGRQARVAGWSQDQLERAVRNGTLVRLRRSCYCLPDPAGPGMASGMPPGSHAANNRRQLQIGIAAALSISGSIMSHRTAAIAHGLPILECADLPCLSLPRGRKTPAPSVHLHRIAAPAAATVGPHRIAAPAAATVGLFGTRVSSVAQACVEIASECGLAAGLVTADAALRDSRTTTVELAARAAALKGQVGAGAARQLCQLADGRAESPLETLSRLQLMRLPTKPELQIPIWTLSGRHVARVDFFWRELGIVGEADGRTKYADAPQALWQEKLREDRLTELGLVVFRWGWAEAVTPGQLAARFGRAAFVAGRLQAAGLLPQIRAGAPSTRDLAA